MPVTYEFIVETLDYYPGCGDDPDIVDTGAYDTLDAAVQATKTVGSLPWRISLRRDVGDDIDGITDRGYAYPDGDGRLPERFETAMGFQDGSPVPARYRRMTFPVDARSLITA